MSGDVKRSLEAAGRQPVAPVDPTYATGLEDRLLAVAVTLPPAIGPTLARPSPVLRRMALVTGIAGLAVVVALVALVTQPTRSVELVAASNVQVALADGTVLEDPGGLLLPDGAIVTVGPLGSARIGDILLGPGDVATVHDGRLQIEHGPAIGVVTPTATATPPVTSSPAAAPSNSGPQVTATPTATRSPQPTTVSATDPPEPTTKPTVASDATPSPAPVIRRPRLRVRLLDGRRLAVTWTETVTAQRYVLLVTASRSGPAPDPVYPGSRVLGEFAVPPMPRLRYRVPDAVREVRLMVVALRGDGSVLRRSRVAVVSLPAVDTAASSADPSPTLTLSPSPTPGP